ncbi:hypothetical protein PVAND_005119 [Polypedilum vanderplanki]|uniref:Peptidase S1 domain-containing protein n=1 Tax=Polypedilum vanderplanki TaxID=319348 RepID=A0A9J6C059_POLVA|nr:hypothetical protein PVAND_005119 [Polypedilum vanderplanki]
MNKILILIILALTSIAICNVIPNENIATQSDLEVVGQLNKIEIERRVTGGNIARVGQFPYKAALNMITNNGDTYICGGNLVRYNWVITTAGCIDGFRQVYLFLGTIAGLGEGHAWKSPSIPERHLFKHPRYNNVVFTNNLGMIYLETATESILNNQNIGLVSLPTRADANFNVVGRNGMFAGYGRTNDQGSSLWTLHYAVLPLVNNTICREVFPDNTTPGILCANTAGGISPCAGDTGSGIVIEVATGRNVLMGVFSYNVPVCSIEIPAVFEEITGHLDWIEETFKNSSPTVGLSFALLSSIIIIVTSTMK